MAKNPRRFVRGAMSTVKGQIRENIAKIDRWEQANPGKSWLIEYPEEEPKVYLPKEMIFSPAYRSLGRVAMYVLQIFYCKRIMKMSKRNKKKIWVVENNGQIVFSYSEAESLGIARTSFRNAIDELQLKGFIDIRHQGSGGRKPAEGAGDFTQFGVDDRWRNFDEEKEISRIPPHLPRRKDTRMRGFRVKEVRKKAELQKNNKCKNCTPMSPMEYKNCTPIGESTELSRWTV